MDEVVNWLKNNKKKQNTLFLKESDILIVFCGAIKIHLQFVNNFKYFINQKNIQKKKILNKTKINSKYRITIN